MKKKHVLPLFLAALAVAIPLIAFADEAPSTTEPQKPQNVQVKVESMEQGTMTAEGWGQVSGTVANLSVSFDKQQGITDYFAAPVRKMTIGAAK